MSSILDDVKHLLGLLPAETAFDSDVLIHINTVFATLNQLGVGPPEGFMIMDNTTQWEAFVDNAKLNSVKSYIFLRVKTMFDPPQIGSLVSSMDNQIKELEWRLMVESDTPYMPEDVIIEGGGA